MTWSVALRLGRISNLPTVWTNVLAGIVLGAGFASPTRTGMLLAALSLFYVGGMYLNDAFDRDIDARERPERPIPSGAITAATVFTLGFSMLGGGLALLFFTGSGWSGAAAGIALGLAIVLYDWKHKNNPLSPVLMGLCRVLVYVAAAFAVTTAVENRLYAGAAVLLFYLIGLTYAAKQENLNRIANLWPLAFLAAPFLYPLVAGTWTPSAVVLYFMFLAWVLYALSHLMVPGRINVPRAVVSLIAGICLLDGLLIALYGGTYLPWIAVGGFALTLGLQRWIPGT